LVPATKCHTTIVVAPEKPVSCLVGDKTKAAMECGEELVLDISEDVFF
jgi:hypothetical protein